MKKGIVTLFSILISLQGFNVVAQETIDPQGETTAESYEEDLKAYVNHLDSFIINLYYKDILNHSSSLGSAEIPDYEQIFSYTSGRRIARANNHACIR